MHAASPGIPRGPLSRSGMPLYRQLEDVLRHSIIERRIEVGQLLPTEEELSERFQVSRITVRQALHELNAQGFIARRRALGTIVLSSKPVSMQGWSVESLEDIVTYGRNTDIDVLSYEHVQDAFAAEALGLMPGEKVYRLRILRLRDRAPFAESDIFIISSVGSRLSLKDFDRPIIFKIIQDRCGIKLAEARQTVWAEVAKRRLAGLLGCRTGSAILRVQRLYIASDGVPVEFAISRYRGDGMKLSYGIRPAVGRG